MKVIDHLLIQEHISYKLTIIMSIMLDNIGLKYFKMDMDVMVIISGCLEIALLGM